MGNPNNVEGILAGAKKTLEKANKFTQSSEGNPTSAFAPHEYSKASYKMPHQARKEKPLTPGEDIAHGLQSNRENVDKYVEATKNQ